MNENRVPTAHVYDIIGHNLPEGEAAPNGIELYTKELVQIRLALEELEQKVTEVSIGRYGFASEKDFDHPIYAVLYLLRNLGSGVVEQDNLEELEREHQSLLSRISDAREAMISGHISRVESIDASDYSSRNTQQQLRKWVEDDTFPDQIEALEAAADRVDRRLTAKRETANARLSLTVSIVTIFVSLLLLGFAVLSFLVSIISTANLLL